MGRRKRAAGGRSSKAALTPQEKLALAAKKLARGGDTGGKPRGGRRTESRALEMSRFARAPSNEALSVFGPRSGRNFSLAMHKTP